VITEVTGVRVGHVTDRAAITGCTVVLLPPDTVASGEVRGGAPATRELSLLAPERMVEHIDAVVLSGGSAFGLAAADGVMAWCEEHGRGFPTSAGRVPIVVGLSLFDLGVGDPSVRPTAADGYRAAELADDRPVELGLVGAGTGARVDKWRGPDQARFAGLGGAVHRDGELVVAALVAVNAAGSIDDGATAAGVRAGTVRPAETGDPFANTTIGVVVTNAALDKQGCSLAAQSGHDGFARALVPSHLRTDGDALVVAATGHVDAELDWVRTLVAVVVEDAIKSTGGQPRGRVADQ